MGNRDRQPFQAIDQLDVVDRRRRNDPRDHPELTVPLGASTHVPSQTWESTMKVMVIVKASRASEAGEMPSQQLLTEMGDFNRALVDAGILLAAEGLHPSSKGVRVRFSGKDRMVTDGPFPETKELIAGFWLWNVKSMDEAVAWVKRCPNPHEEAGEIEIRPVFSIDDFGEALTPELRERDASLRTNAGIGFPQVRVRARDFDRRAESELHNGDAAEHSGVMATVCTAHRHGGRSGRSKDLRRLLEREIKLRLRLSLRRRSDGFGESAGGIHSDHSSRSSLRRIHASRTRLDAPPDNRHDLDPMGP